MRRILALAFSTSVVVASAQQAPPQFRAGIALTRLEVTVLDKKTRVPITGLTANDFIVKVNGRPQPLASLAEVSVPGAAGSTAPGLAESARDVTTNDLAAPRLFVIVMNDVTTGGHAPMAGNTGRAIANRIVDLLGPHDLAAVVFVRDNSFAQDLVQDRTLLRRAIDQYQPQGLEPDLAKPMATKVLVNAVQFLRPMSSYRRAVVFISPAMPPSREPSMPGLKEFSLAAAALYEIDLAKVSGTGGLATVPVYMFSAQGLPAPTPAEIRSIAAGASPLQWFDDHMEGFRTIADLTGGRATVATNTPAEGVPAMFNELSSYYALAYEPTDPADARIRRLDVQVNRRDALVVSSRQVVAADSAVSGAGSGTPTTGLRTALESPVPFGALPLRLGVLPVPVNGAREHAVVITVGLPPVAAAERFGIRALVYDGEGRQQVLDTARTVDLAKSTDAEGSEVVFRVQLRPGRYNVRVAAERSSDRVAGTVHATVEIPDFARAVLSLSGVAIGRGDGRRIGGRQEIDGLLPFAPTAMRTFDARDRVGALVRVEQGASRPVAVTMTTSIADALGAVLVTKSDIIAATAFANGEAEHRFEIPLADLPPGPYLLRFVATIGATSAQREVRFLIR